MAEGDPELRSRRRRVIGAAVACVLLVLVVVAWRLVASTQTNVMAAVACRDLPTLAQVDAELQRQSELVGDLVRLGDGISVEVVQHCSGVYAGRAEIYVFVATDDELDQVARLLSRRPFSVPVSILNV
jgi:hypothetical protein